MYAKASFFLFAFFLLMLPMLNANHSSTQLPSEPATVTPDERTPEITPEAMPEVTPEATVEATEVVLVGDPARGDEIFHNGIAPAPACINCHNPTVTGKNGFALGPGLKGISVNGSGRVEGLTAPQYIEQSIRHPGAYIVGGFRDIMYPNFATDYSDQNIADLVAYLMTL